MKKTLLSSIVVSLLLAGCGGGGGGSSSSVDNNNGGNNGGGGNTTPPASYTLAQLADFDNEYAQNWYQFNENEENDFSHFTHSNYHEPYEFAFKDNKILSKINSSMDSRIYPTYSNGSTIIEYSANDTADNIDNMQRIGILQGKPDLIGTGEDTKLVLSFKPYKGETDLVVNMTYKVTSLDGKRMGQTANPTLYQAVNNSITASEFINGDDYKRYIPALWNAHSSKLSTKTFGKNTACLTVQKIETNHPTFFAKYGGKTSTTEREEYDAEHGLVVATTITDADQNKLTQRLPTTVSSYADVPQKMSMVYAAKDQPSYAHTSYIGNYINKALDANNVQLSNIDDIYDAVMAAAKELNTTVDPAFNTYIKIAKENVGKGCDLYNREARNQLRDFLIEVNNRVD